MTRASTRSAPISVVCADALVTSPDVPVNGAVSLSSAASISSSTARPLLRSWSSMSLDSSLAMLMASDLSSYVGARCSSHATPVCCFSQETCAFTQVKGALCHVFLWNYWPWLHSMHFAAETLNDLSQANGSSARSTHATCMMQGTHISSNTAGRDNSKHTRRRGCAPATCKLQAAR